MTGGILRSSYQESDELRDDMTFHDRRDLVDEMNVISSALSHIELDMMQTEAS